MSKVRDILRPVFRLITKPHIRNLCKSTEHDFVSYKDKYAGRRCFVVANGPSLKVEDLNKLHDYGEITFGMNRIYMMFDRTIWRPTYYIVQDPTIIRSCIEEIRGLTKITKVFFKSPGEHRYDVEGAINFDLDYTRVNKYLTPDFYNGDKCTFADGRSVAHTAVQLAVYMGFKEINLLGADCNYSIDNKSINSNSYPDERMYDPKKIGLPPDIEYMFRMYTSSKEYATRHGIRIQNATRGGKLEIFDRVDFDSLFSL